ncbi:MAG TPA: hypothetical protein VF933_07800 [Streptosporangiaceae bacterium]
MSRTPAAQLAGLKVAFPYWSISHVQPGKGAGFTAHRRLGGGWQLLYAATLAELEHELRLADKRD